jgi:hypothetical protein
MSFLDPATWGIERAGYYVQLGNSSNSHICKVILILE